MIGPETSIGLLLSLVSFLRSEIGGRKSQKELISAIEAQDTIQRYLEWFRRQEQEALLLQIEESKSDLLESVSSLGQQLQTIALAIGQQAGDLEYRLHNLNERIRPPVLSLLPLSTRPRVNIAVKGRKRERDWLVARGTDSLVFGQPGSGKTALLLSIAPELNARFVITDNPDEAAAALLLSPPPTIVVDDAGTKRDLIIRLRHLRAERNLNFCIIAICWPFDKPILQQALQLNETATLELEGLPRRVIAEIITDIAAEQAVEVSDQFIRVVAKQARGMPGLAAALSVATIAATSEKLVSGELLLRDLTPFLLSVAGPHTVQLLGAFACGGRKGISFAAVARNLEKGILEVQKDSERVALAGVLEQTGKETLCVQPEFLRSALLKETFFPTAGLPLPWDVCEALIKSAEDPVLGYLEIFHASARAGAAVPIELLRKITTQVDNLKLWGAMAILDETSCEWVVKSAPTLSADIKRAALHYIPSRIIPILLGDAVAETRPLYDYPQADMKLLEEWVSGGWNDAVKRRRVLFNEAILWLKSGGDSRAALSAVRLSFGLNHHESDSDPADPKTLRWRDALLPLDAAKAVFTQWGAFLVELSSIDTVPWAGVTAVVDNWLRNDTRQGDGLPGDYVEFLISSATLMIGDLLPLASGNQAALRWIYLKSQALATPIDPCPVDQNFMTLYPKERFDGDWEKIKFEQTHAAQELATCWKERSFQAIVDDLSKWETQANLLGNVWPRMADSFAAKLADIRVLTNIELSLVIRSLSASTAIPFVEAALSHGQMSPEHFQEALGRPDLHGFLIIQTLIGKTPELYGSLEPHIPRWGSLVDSLCLRGEVTVPMLERLLSHQDERLCREITFQMFRGKRGIPTELRTVWRGNIVRSLLRFVEGYDANHPHDLPEIFAFDSSIATSMLDVILNSENHESGYYADGLMAQLVAPLGKEERQALLHRCTHLAYSALPHLLVGRDEDLYREMLSIPELKDSYNMALIGDPNDGNWIALARIALTSGYSHKELCHAVDSGGYSWSGRLSTYYDQWIERFEKLRQHTDQDMQLIAEQGLKWSKARRDAERRSERKEEIHGWD